MDQEWLTIKPLYEDMRNKIERITKLGRISEEIRKEHKGFLDWNNASTLHDLMLIVQIRESSKISNGSIFLNVDCDMCSNNSESVTDALWFFMDAEKGHEIAYVQFLQCYCNLTRNDLYGTCSRVINEVELPGLVSNGGPCYIDGRCFRRREALCGMKYSRECERMEKRK